MSSQSPEEIQADIERQREQLAQTVDRIGHKLDVKSQARAKVDDVKVQTQARVADVKDRSTTEDGKPRPEVVGAGVAVVAGLALLIWLRRRR
jgi:MYXO-CTERM domain-containing protein